MKNSTLSDFLAECRISSEKAIAALSQLSETLENPATQQAGVVLLNELVATLSHQKYQETRNEYNFHFFEMEIPNGLNDSFRLRLLQLPSTFAPEEWSFTFFEGISRYSPSEFQSKKMVELGCGNGWVSLSVALKYNCHKIYGLDINPKAILCSKINLFLNAFDEKNQLLRTEDDRSLLDKVEFHVSDLLRHCYTNKIAGFDVIVGCIPQVLAPEESIDIKKINNESNDDFLYSLSNYTSEQGLVEDKFGLGLIARSVEESIDLLKPEGKLILNLGERPRREVLERLIKRRGMLVKRIWKRKVAQANDTDIDSLVRLEKEMNHHFEFYTDLHSETPINAKAAKLYASKGRIIYHNLSVYECTFDYYTETKLLFDELKNELFSEAKTGLDLDYEDRNKKEEKIRFLAELVRNLRQTNHFPYESNQGEIKFRKSLASFLRLYQHVNFSEENIFIAPNLESLTENIIDIYNPTTIFLPDYLFGVFPQLKKEDKSVCTPHCSKELNALIEIIKPQIVFSKISAEALILEEYFKKIIDISEKVNTRLFIDISDCFDLSSSPKTNGVFQYLANHQLPIHVSLICELSKNQIYSDLKTCFLITNNATSLQYLQNAAEFSYSRSPYLSQLFYTILVKELTNFQMKKIVNSDVFNQILQTTEPVSLLGISAKVAESFEHSAIKGNELKVDKNTVRLDYGENELSCPDDLKISILESFTCQKFTIDEFEPKQHILTFISNRFGLNNLNNIYYGNGVAPLFSAIVKLIKEDNGTLLMPQGAYGYFHATAKFYDINIKIIATKRDNKFILAADDLELAISTTENPWVFLNFPLINPTGALWEEHKIEEISRIKGIEKTQLIIDTVFSGLEFDGVNKSSALAKLEEKTKIILLGGISKEYSAGGIRFGFALANYDCKLNEKLMFTPHHTVKFTAKKIFSKYNENSERIAKELDKQTKTLKYRSEILSNVLRKYGWDVPLPKGGLFLIASPVSFIGKKVKCSYQEKPVEITAQNINLILHDKSNLLINNDEWTGIPDYCRFVLSVEETKFTEGINRLEKFHETIFAE